MWPFKKKQFTTLDLANAIWGEIPGAPISAETAVKVADIYSCVRVLSSTVASLPLALKYTDTKRGKAAEHPYYRLVHRSPNSWMTPSDFKRILVTFLMLRGNFYAYKNIVAGQIKELIPLHPDRVEVKQNEDLSISYKIDNRILDASQVLHIRGLSLNGHIGENIVSIMSDIFGYSREAMQFQNRALRNGAKPSGLLVFPDALKDEQYKQEVKRINDAASGDKVGSTLILDRGVDFKKISLTTSDLLLLDSMKLTRSQICGAFGIPPHLIGDLDRATFSNIEHQSLSYYMNAVMPTCSTIEDALNGSLLNEKEQAQFCFKFNPNAILRGDIKSRMEAYQLGIMNGIYSPDEVRELEDLPPRSDGLGGQYYYPANLLPAGTETKQTTNENVKV